MLDVKDDHGRTPLHYACQNGQEEAVKLLVGEYHCRAMAKDNLGVTPLQLATVTVAGHLKIAQFLSTQIQQMVRFFNPFFICVVSLLAGERSYTVCQEIFYLQCFNQAFCLEQTL